MRNRSQSDLTPIIDRERIMPPSKGVPNACLITIYGPELGKRYDLAGRTETIIGRDEDADLTIPALAISRRHARIFTNRGRYFIEDMNSTNGTFINDFQITQPVELELHDRIQLANVILKFLSGDDVESLYNEELYSLSTTDGLLGIPNRRYLMTALEKEISRSRRHRHDLSIMMIDIDFFKKVNDTYGHLAGDAALKHLVRLIRENTRKEELLCRFGGEEFVLVLPETGPSSANTVAEKLRQIVQDTPLIFDGEEIAFTISIGVATWDDRLKTTENLIKKADERLYLAKTSGRNRVVGMDSTVNIKSKTKF